MNLYHTFDSIFSLLAAHFILIPFTGTFLFTLEPRKPVKTDNVHRRQTFIDFIGNRQSTIFT